MKFWFGIAGICLWVTLALTACTVSQTQSGSGTVTNKPVDSTTTNTNTSNG
jgi:hypothetical protein